MDRKKTVWAAAAVLLLVIAGAWLIFRSSDEGKIREVLDDLCAMTAKNPAESPAMSALSAARPDRVFASVFSVQVDKPRHSGDMACADVGKLLTSLRNNWNSASLELSSLDIEVSGDSAVVECNARLSGRNRRSEYFEEVRVVNFGFSRIEGEWKVTSLSVEMPLQR